MTPNDLVKLRQAVGMASQIEDATNRMQALADAGNLPDGITPESIAQARTQAQQMANPFAGMSRADRRLYERQLARAGKGVKNTPPKRKKK